MRKTQPEILDFPNLEFLYLLFFSKESRTNYCEKLKNFVFYKKKIAKYFFVDQICSFLQYDLFFQKMQKWSTNLFKKPDSSRNNQNIVERLQIFS